MPPALNQLSNTLQPSYGQATGHLPQSPLWLQTSPVSPILSHAKPGDSKHQLGWLIPLSLGEASTIRQQTMIRHLRIVVGNWKFLLKTLQAHLMIIYGYLWVLLFQILIAFIQWFTSTGSRLVPRHLSLPKLNLSPAGSWIIFVTWVGSLSWVYKRYNIYVYNTS